LDGSRGWAGLAVLSIAVDLRHGLRSEGNFSLNVRFCVSDSNVLCRGSTFSSAICKLLRANHPLFAGMPVLREPQDKGEWECMEMGMQTAQYGYKWRNRKF